MWGAANRPDQAHLYLSTSEYPNTFIGFFEFLIKNTYSLFWEMLIPVGIQNNPLLGTIFMIGCGLLLTIAVFQVVRQKEDQNTTFSAFFAMMTLLVLFISSILELYPYGTVRYIPYLTFPIILMISIGAAWLYRWTIERLLTFNTHYALNVFISINLLVLGSYLIFTRYNKISRIELDNYQVINWARSQSADLFLADNYISPILSLRAPEVYDHVQRIGWGEWLGHKDVVPEEISELIKGSDASPPINSIMVILFPSDISPGDPHNNFEERFPQWDNLLSKYFHLETAFEALHIRVELYYRN
jgi:hypothetical protein